MTVPTAVAIASESPYTVEAGTALADIGGNAVDIAVGAALAATVSEALMCSMGGSAFINIKLPGSEPELIDGADAMPEIPEKALADSEKAWRQADIPYGDGISVNVGHASVAVPGMLRALELSWRRHGCLPWAEIVAPAVALARSGTTANQTLVNWLGMAGHAVFFDQQESRATFFPDGATPLQHGEFYRPPHLAGQMGLPFGPVQTRTTERRAGFRHCLCLDSQRPEKVSAFVRQNKTVVLLCHKTTATHSLIHTHAHITGEMVVAHPRLAQLSVLGSRTGAQVAFLRRKAHQRLKHIGHLIFSQRIILMSPRFAHGHETAIRKS